MSTELVKYGELSYEEIAKLTGQNVVKGPAIPTMTINRESVDDKENNIPVGTFAISQGDMTVYGKTATIRPFINTYQYRLYDAKEGKTTNRTIQFKNWGEEAIDEKGGLKCGKVTGKAAQGLSEAEKAKNDAVKCYRYVYCTVSLNGVTASGEKTEVTNVPARLKLRGVNYMPIGNAFDAIGALKRPIFDFNIGLSLSRQKNGATTYYLMGVDPDLKNVLKMTQEDWDTFDLFQQLIERENNYISEKHVEAIKAKTSPADISREKTVAALDADFEDEIPWETK
jgi:hypothetical protein